MSTVARRRGRRTNSPRTASSRSPARTPTTRCVPSPYPYYTVCTQHIPLLHRVYPAHTPTTRCVPSAYLYYTVCTQRIRQGQQCVPTNASFEGPLQHTHTHTHSFVQMHTQVTHMHTHMHFTFTHARARYTRTTTLSFLALIARIPLSHTFLPAGRDPVSPS